MPPVGFEPTISAGERPQTYALDRAATGTGILTPMAIANIILKRMKHIYRAFKIQLKAANYIMGFKAFSLDFLRNFQKS